MYNDSSTITAVSTPAGSGGIAVVRLSGPDAFTIADSVWKGSRLSKAHSHTAHLGEISDSDGSMLDQAIATVFAEGRSFTGEPTVEFSIHGSKWLQKRVVERLIEAGASSAASGEFTRRAFLNGRLDLAQAEAVGDMIAASSKAAQRLAANQMKGTFSRHLESLRNEMIHIASLLELELDFSEEDVEFADRDSLLKMTRNAKKDISSLADSFRAGRALKEGVAVAIIGAPNAGKSTLLNHLLREDKAIVSDIAGTTRDIIEDTAEIDGILFRFIDTAGLRSTSDSIERIGVQRAIEAAEKADIILWLIDPSSIPGRESLPVSIKDILPHMPEDTPVLKIITKSDLRPGLGSKSGMLPHDALSISAKTGHGISRLKERLTETAQQGADTTSDYIVTNARHYECLLAAAEALTRVEESIAAGLPSDLTAQDLRSAIHHLGAITGAITPTDLLHSIFSHFCIGK